LMLAITEALSLMAKGRINFPSCSREPQL